MNVAQRQYTPRKPSQKFICKAEVLKNTEKIRIPVNFQQTTNKILHKEFLQSLRRPENHIMKMDDYHNNAFIWRRSATLITMVDKY